MTSLEYKGTKSTRWKALMLAVWQTMLVFLLFSALLVSKVIDEEAWKFVAGVWAGTINLGLIGYALSEVGVKHAVAKSGIDK